jgi:uroporphyrin-3 C-methyltransferase
LDDEGVESRQDMSETNNESGNGQAETEAQFKEAIEGEVERIEETRSASGLSRLPMVLAVLALLAVSVGLVFGYRYWLDMKQTLVSLNDLLAQANQEQSHFEQQLEQTRRDFAQQRQLIEAQKARFEKQAETIRQAKEASQQQGDQLYRSLSEIQTRMGGKEGQWRVAEAEYLMRVANHRLNLMGDPDTAIEALKSADERLNASGDPGWSGVRETIATEITRLTALPRVDHAGISGELSALEERVQALPLRDSGVVQGPVTARSEDLPTAAGNAESRLDRLLDDFWQGFKSMMVIRHHDRPVTAMLPPEQRYFLIQNLRLKIENAKAAMMGRNQALYADNLNSAIGWIDRYFLISAPEVVGFKSQLQQLAARVIAPELPDISASIRALQKRRQSMNREDLR